MALFWVSLGLLVVALVVLYAFLYGVQGRILFPSTHEMDRYPDDVGWAYDEIRLAVDGQETYGWFIPLEGSRGVILFSHGNAGNLAGRLESIALLRSFGFSVLAYDYGGYGHSSGSPSEQRCYADIRAMWAYLTEDRGVPAEKIVLFGRSLGAGPTTELARYHTAGAVILESAFLSTVDVARSSWLFRPMAWAIRHRFANKDKVGEIASPLLLIHSPEDEVIPFSHGEMLFKRAADPKTFLQIQGPHNRGFVDSPNYVPGWESFLSPLFGPKPKT